MREGGCGQEGLKAYIGLIEAKPDIGVEQPIYDLRGLFYLLLGGPVHDLRAYQKLLSQQDLS